MLTFISAVANSDETSVLTAVQLLWVNLIMDTFAALALATDPPTPSILNRKPEPKSAPLITLTMWKLIIGQSSYQLIVTLILYFAGSNILNYQDEDAEVLQTLIFNTFVWMQVFNQYNSRRLDNNFNIFEGITRNYFFIAIQLIIIAGQVMIIFVGGAAFSVHRQTVAQWGVALVLGILSIPVAVILRLIPDGFIRRLIPEYFVREKTPRVFISDEERQYQWNPALENLKEELAFLKKLRGGRLNVLKYKLQHPRDLIPLPRSRSGSRSRASSMPQTPTGEQASELGNHSPAPPTPESRRSMNRRRDRSRSNSAFGPAAAMAGIVAGSIAGWSPIERREGEGNFSKSATHLHNRADLDEMDGTEVHPDTKPDDPVIAENSQTMAIPPSQNQETSPFGQQLSPSSARNPPGSLSRMHKPHASA